MLKLFRTSSPYSVIALFLVAILLKLNYLIHPVSIAALPDQVIWNSIVAQTLHIFGNAAFGFTFLGIINIVFQGIYLSRISWEFNLFPYDSYLPALSFILVTSLFPDWNYISAFSITNWFILIAFKNIFQLYALKDGNKSLFNIGALISLSAIFVFPYILFLILFFIGLAVLRSFKLKEWLMLFLGIFTPIYILLSVFFLTDNMLVLKELIPFGFSFQHFQQNAIATYLSLGLLSLFLIIGFFYLNVFSSRMLMQVKKNWGIILVYLIVSLLVGVFSVWSGFSVWLPAILPISLIFTNLWFEERKSWIAKVVFYLFIAVIIFVQWVPL